MAEVAPNSFENMSHSGILKLPSKDNKDVSLTLDVYRGNVSFAIFTGAGGAPWKLGLPMKVLSNIVILLRKMQREPSPCREAIDLKEWLAEEKKFKVRGCLAFGIDDTRNVFIDVQENGLSGGKHTFVIKGDGKFDFSQTSLTEKDHLQARLQFLIDAFSIEAIVAERLSSFKRTPGQGGGNKGGYGGGGGNRGGYNNNGGGGNRQQSNTFSGGDVEDSLYV